MLRPTPEQFKTCKKLLKHWRAVAQSSQQALDWKVALEGLSEDIRRVDKSDFLALQNLEKKTGKLIRETALARFHVLSKARVHSASP